MAKGDVKNFFKKFWQIVWKDDSLKGWIISIIFLFILIKFIIFPTLNLVTGTSLPLAIVESCSMYHKGNLFSSFDSWWENHQTQYTEIGIQKEDFEIFGFKKGFNKGDILFIVGAKPDKLEIGDIIIFNAGTNHPVIHRIINIKHENEKYTFSTMGDNVGRTQFFEEEIKEDALVGKAVFKIIPYVGWIKLIGVDIWYKIFPGESNYIKTGLCK